MYLKKYFIKFIYFASYLDESVMIVPGVQLSRDPGYRSTGFPAAQGKSRRQSMLL